MLSSGLYCVQPDNNDAAAVFDPIATWKAEIRAGNFGCQTGAFAWHCTASLPKRIAGAIGSSLDNPVLFPLLELSKENEAFSPSEPECGSPLWGTVSFLQKRPSSTSINPWSARVSTLNLRDVRAKGERGYPLAQVAQVRLHNLIAVSSLFRRLYGVGGRHLGLGTELTATSTSWGFHRKSLDSPHHYQKFQVIRVHYSRAWREISPVDGDLMAIAL